MEYYDESEGYENESDYPKTKSDKDDDIKLYSIKDAFAVILVIVLLSVAAIFAKLVYTYEMPVFDPIAELKSTIMDIELFFVMCSAGFLIISLVLKDSVRKVHKWLAASVIFSLIMMVGLLGSKIYMDMNYDTNKFVEFYETEEYAELIGDVTLEEYSLASKEGYENFTTKCMINIIINMMILGIEIRYFYKTNTMMIKQEKIREYDEALFDTETNVKI